MKEAISKRQGISMIILLILSEAFVIGPTKNAKSDIWIAILLGFSISFLVALVYCRILVKFPGKNLYEIITTVFGKIIGNIICVLYIVYCFYIGALVLDVFILFTNIVGLVYTPALIIGFIVMILVITGLKMGLEVLGRWSEFFARIIYPIIILTIPLMLYMVEVFNLTPVLANGLKPVVNGALEVITFPFAEIFTFMLILNTNVVQKPKNIYKIFLIGLMLGGIALFLTHITAYLTLGEFFYSSSYFPIYTAVSRINIKEVLQRVESVIAIVFILGGFMKITIYMLAGCKGIASIMKLEDYKFIVTPICILVLIVALTSVRSIMDMVVHVYYYTYLAVLMQIIIPFIILIAVEIKGKIMKHKAKHIQQ